MTADLSNIHEWAGAVIGPYKLLEQIGEGVMGVVDMADEQKPVHIALHRVLQATSAVCEAKSRRESDHYALMVASAVDRLRKKPGMQTSDWDAIEKVLADAKGNRDRLRM